MRKLIYILFSILIIVLAILLLFYMSILYGLNIKYDLFDLLELLEPKDSLFNAIKDLPMVLNYSVLGYMVLFILVLVGFSKKLCTIFFLLFDAGLLLYMLVLNSSIIVFFENTVTDIDRIVRAKSQLTLITIDYVLWIACTVLVTFILYWLRKKAATTGIIVDKQ